MSRSIPGRRRPFRAWGRGEQQMRVLQAATPRPVFCRCGVITRHERFLFA